MKIAEIINPYVGETGGLITALQAVQAAHGFLPPETEAVAAEAFNLSKAEVKGVISFYADFHRGPQGKTVVRLCAAEACQAAGGRDLAAAVEKKFALNSGETSVSGFARPRPLRSSATRWLAAPMRSASKTRSQNTQRSRRDGGAESLPAAGFRRP